MPAKKQETEAVAETQQATDDADYGLPPEKPKAIFGSVAAVMRELATKGIGKNQPNEQQGYMFRGIDDILNILSGLFVKNNILVRPRYGDRVLAEYKTAKGTRMASVTLAGVFHLISTVDGSALEFGPFYGEGMDTGDKATNKAMATAFKYFAIQTFVIPIVGNDDADLTTPEEVTVRDVAQPTQAVASAPQARPEVKNLTDVEATIRRLAPAGPKRKKLVELVTQAYSVVLPEQIPEDKRAEAIKKLEAYVAKNAEAAKAKRAA